MGCDSHEDDKSSTSSLWYVGVILSVVGSIMTNMGVNMQKYSFMSEAKRSLSMKRGYFRQPLWVIGTFRSLLLSLSWRQAMQAQQSGVVCN